MVWPQAWSTAKSIVAGFGIVATVFGAGVAVAAVRHTAEADVARITNERIEALVPPMIEAAVGASTEVVRSDIEALSGQIGQWREDDIEWRLASVQARASKEELRALEQRMQRELDLMRERGAAPPSPPLPLVDDVWPAPGPNDARDAAP